MDKGELEDKLVEWCLTYLEEKPKTERIPFAIILWNVIYKLSNLIVAKNLGNIAAAAKELSENRTTLAERMRTKCNIPDADIEKMCEKHRVPYHPRQRKKHWYKNALNNYKGLGGEIDL